jgi:hypothetical protein
MVKVYRKRSCRIFRPGSCYINVDTEGIVLRSVESCGAMAGDNFMAKDVVP